MVSERTVATKCTVQRCIDYVEIVEITGRFSARVYNQNTVAKIAIFNLYTRKYLANGK